MNASLGVALSAAAMLAHREGGAAPWFHPITLLDHARGWSDLAPAMQELRRTVGRHAGALHVALLPPLVQLRRIELPRLTEDERRAVLARDAHRYLLDPPAAPLAVAWTAPETHKSPVPYLVAFADADLVASVHSAAAQAGFGTTRVLPAYAAWEAGARRHAPVVRQGRGRLVVEDEHLVEALVFDGGRIQLCRRAVSADDAALLQGETETFEHDGPAVSWLGVVAPHPVRQRIEGALRERGISPVSLFDECPTLGTPAALAAAGAPLARCEGLLPQPIRLERWRRERRLSHRLLGAAAATLLLSAALELWGAHRELAALRAERLSLRPLVAQAMDLRRTMDGVHERLGALAAAEGGASRWTEVITNVADHLPSDAHLINLRGEGDSLVLEGVASRAAGAFESLRRAPGVVGVRAEAPIRQEAQDSAAPVERFSLGARLTASRAGEGVP